MRKTLLALTFLLAGSTLSLQADTLVAVLVNTSSLAGTSGYVDFQFNPGNTLGTQSATLAIEKFAGATYLTGSQLDTGGASGGPLPATVTLLNSTSYNDDNEGIKFGGLMTFLLDFSGSAITAPNGTATSGSGFYFSLTDASGNPLLTTDPNGIDAFVNVNTNGTITEISNSANVVFTPEPASLLMLGSSLPLLITAYRRRNRW